MTEGQQPDYLVGTLAHDLKAPLSLIRALALDNDQPDAATLQLIANYADEGLSLVGDLLDVYKLQKSQSQLYPFLASDLLKVDSYCHISPKTQQRLKVTNQLKSANQKLVLGDKLVVQRCLNNLLSNSLKYSQGAVKLKSWDLSPQAVAFEISDKGPAIEEVDKQALNGQLFNYGSKRAAGSTGLGLYLVGQMVDYVGGTVELLRSGNTNISLISLPVVRQQSLF